MSKPIYIKTFNAKTGKTTERRVEGSKINIYLKSLEIKEGREVIWTIPFTNIRIRNAKTDKYISTEAFNKLQAVVPAIFLYHDEKLVDINFNL